MHTDKNKSWSFEADITASVRKSLHLRPGDNGSFKVAGATSCGDRGYSNAKRFPLRYKWRAIRGRECTITNTLEM